MEIDSRICEKFGTWTRAFTEFIDSGDPKVLSEMDKLMQFIKGEAGKGKTIIPKSADTFKSLALCDKSKLKSVVVLMDPYPTMKNGQMIANGIPMDTSNTGVPQASIDMWYHGIEKEYGFNPDMQLRNDLSYLLVEENVLLINSSLSVEMGKSGSHSIQWQPFMKHLFKVLNEGHKGLPIVLCGSAAQKYEKEINPMLHYIKKVEHPVAASYANRAWNSEGMFKWVNQIIESNNGPEEKIQWYRLKPGKEKVKDTELPDWVTHKMDGTPHEANALGKLPWE